MSPPALRADEERLDRPEAGIVVRGVTTTGRWGAVDIAHLDKSSLRRWLRKDKGLAERVVFRLLGHPAE